MGSGTEGTAAGGESTRSESTSGTADEEKEHGRGKREKEQWCVTS